MMSFLVTLIFVLVIAGLLIWAVQAFLPMVPAMFRNLICFVIVILAVLWLWNGFGGAVVIHSR